MHFLLAIAIDVKAMSLFFRFRSIHCLFRAFEDLGQTEYMVQYNGHLAASRLSSSLIPDFHHHAEAVWFNIEYAHPTSA